MKNKHIKVILDTNLFVAAYFNPYSYSAKIINWCLKNKIENYITKNTFNELKFILKRIRAPLIYKEKVYQLIEKSILIKINKINKIFLIKEDIEDNKFLALARKSKADFLITNDKHLLKLKRFNKTIILKPTDFYHLIKNKINKIDYES